MDRLSREDEELKELQRKEQDDIKRKAKLTQMQASFTAQMDKNVDES